MKLIKNNHILIALFAVFIATRFLGLGQLYHQDEYRWASIANPAFGELAAPHPPINKLSLQLVGSVFGYDWLRLVPFIFSIFSFYLIYLTSRRLSGSKKTALVAAGLFVANVYSLIANLQVDIDGAILPFFVLLSYYFYLRVVHDKNTRFLPLLAISLIGGFLTKLSFALFVGALAVDFVFRIYGSKGWKINYKKLLGGVGVLAVILSGFYFFYAASQPVVIEYAENFKILNFGSRAYFDLGFKLFKSLIWLSPLLLLPVLYGLFKKQIWAKYRIWFIYLFFNLVFYLVLFDFTKLTVERYFMFSIIPSILIAADVLSSWWPKFNTTSTDSGISMPSHLNQKYLAAGLGVLGLLIIVMLFINQAVIPLNPKSAYVDRVKNLDFNFLIPLTGGSGPIGFYASAQFILWVWVLCLIALLLYKKKQLIYIFLIVGLGYNILLSNEYLHGDSYGSVNNITKQAVAYASEKDNIEEVITYYDAGAYYLRLANKYHSRFYTAPSRDYSKKLTEYRGHYLIVDFPAIDKKSQYWELIIRCPIEKEFKDEQVQAYIFDCTKLRTSL